MTMTATEFPLSACPDHPELAIYADWLETEQGRSDEAEALRLSLVLVRPTTTWPGRDPARLEMESRLRTLAEQGITAPFPTLGVGPGIIMQYIPPGAFWMGSPEDEPERQSGEILHPVTITRGFWLADFPMTQEQWAAVTGARPSHFQGEHLPVESVSWNDCQTMLERLREQTGLAGWCLPSEARWEYACRAGTTSPFFWGQNLTTDQANYDGSYPYNGGPKGQNRKRTTPRGTFLPNAWGLQDMHGNVWEWCQDEYKPYTAEPVVEGEQRDPFTGTGPDGLSECSGGADSARPLTGPDRQSDGGRSRATTTGRQGSAPASREGEQGSDPIGASGADGGTTRLSSAAQRIAVGSSRTTEGSCSASASASSEGEQRGPFTGTNSSGWSVAADGVMTATDPGRHITDGISARSLISASASASREGEQGRPFVAPSSPSHGAGPGSARPECVGRSSGPARRSGTQTSTSASASAWPEHRAVRGGNYRHLFPSFCRSVSRYRNRQGLLNMQTGLRLCLLGG